MVLSTTISSYAQTAVKTTEVCGKKPAKIEKKQIPKVVTEPYYKEYPATLNENWYGYPTFINESDWYGYNPYLYATEFPEYYIAEFTKENVPQKVIYSKTGKKVATHKKITSDLPKVVSLTISKSEYSTWKMAKEKEEIFRDADADNMKVYKVEVEKGKEKHYLFISSEGVLLKDKTIKL